MLNAEGRSGVKRAPRRVSYATSFRFDADIEPGMTAQGAQPLFLSTKHAPPALRIRLQRSSASPRVSAPKRTW
jgi:hypothetical protein